MHQLQGGVKMHTFNIPDERWLWGKARNLWILTVDIPGVLINETRPFQEVLKKIFNGNSENVTE